MDDEDVTRSNDPQLVAARVFIGNLPTEQATKQEINDIFSRYGNVIVESSASGIALLKGFGFVQYKYVSEARAAVLGEHLCAFKGHRLDLKIASEGRKRPAEAMNNFANPRAPMQHAMMRPMAPMPPPAAPYMNMGDMRSMGQRFPEPSFAPDRRAMDHQQHQQAFYTPPMGRVAPSPSSADMMAGVPRPLPPVGLVEPLRAPVVQAAAAPADAPRRTTSDVGVERPFDCAIVLCEHDFRSYAEMIERRLIELSLNIDLIVLLKADVSARVMEALSAKGLLYVVVIEKKHAEHKSVTVMVLHGTPQEHRNIPLDDALQLLARDFGRYMTRLRSGSEQPSLSFLLHLLADGKHMSEAELGRVVEHLRERRDRAVQAAPADSAPSGGAAPSSQASVQQLNPAVVDAKPTGAAELQQKILSILGGGNAASVAATQQATAPTPAKGTVAAMFPTTTAPSTPQLSATELAQRAIASLAAGRPLAPDLQSTLQSLLQNSAMRNAAQSAAAAEQPADANAANTAGRAAPMQQSPQRDDRDDRAQMMQRQLQQQQQQRGAMQMGATEQQQQPPMGSFQQLGPGYPGMGMRPAGQPGGMFPPMNQQQQPQQHMGQMGMRPMTQPGTQQQMPQPGFQSFSRGMYG